MAGSSELMTSGWSSNISMAAGWFRRSFTSFITYMNEMMGNASLNGAFLSCHWAHIHTCDLLLGCVPGWRWGTPPLPRLSSWTEVW